MSAHPQGETVNIEGLGARGDGLAMIDGARVPVAFALPGERVVIRREADRGRLITVLTPSADRITPECPHFTQCGGCAVQHLAPEPVRDWKRGRIETALRRARLDAAVLPVIDAHGAGRRRITLHVRLPKQGAGPARAGFMRARSHDVIDLDHCPLLVEELAPAPEIAREIGHALRGLNKPLDVQVTAAVEGLDCDIRGAGTLPEGLRLKLIALAGSHGLARLTLHGERLMEARVPSIRLEPEGLSAFLPPGSFLQATARAEATLAGLAQAGLAGARHVADLFCGLGPFGLRLGRVMKVTGHDSDGAAIAAFQRSIRANPGGKPISAEARDLFRRPLFASELKPFDAVLLDPPRQGAEAQIREIAKSKLGHVVYVSCDPESFARDAQTLVAAGFALGPVQPVDQFRHSAHVELVAVLRR
jgi:23S rRNA (uracil1939-C5)-methyltransferase